MCYAMCGQISKGIRETGHTLPRAECCYDAVRSTPGSIIFSKGTTIDKEHHQGHLILHLQRDAHTDSRSRVRSRVSQLDKLPSDSVEHCMPPQLMTPLHVH